jgi:hypothetical protein
MPKVNIPKISKMVKPSEMREAIYFSILLPASLTELPEINA